MRKPMMAGNWKMNKNIAEAVALAKAIREAVNDEDGVDRVVCPPFVDLPAVAEVLAGQQHRGRRPEHALGGQRRLHGRGERRRCWSGWPNT